MAETDIVVEVDSCSMPLYIPNAFSPNDDGINDVFQALGNDFEILEFKVFDRWGTLVHNSVAPWSGDRLDGKCYPQGLYVYLLNIRINRLNVYRLFKGNVTLLR